MLATGAAAPNIALNVGWERTANMGMWSKARELAEMAPPERNRWVDFLRAISILAVVFGHVGLSVTSPSAAQTQPRSGRGMAIAGLVMGYLIVQCFVCNLKP